MAILLTVADNQDGTGCVATVAGADAATVTIYAQRVDATGLYTLVFASVGSRTGDGTVSLALASGYFWLYAAGLVSSVPVLSNVVYAPVTTSTQAVITRCRLALGARFMGLVMPTVAVGGSPPNARVYHKIFPNEAVVSFPCIFLTIQGERETQPGTLNNRDDIGYGVICSLVDRNPNDNDVMLPFYEIWREQMMRATRHQRLAGVPEVFTVSLEPKPVIDPELPKYALLVSSFVARPISREVRG